VPQRDPQTTDVLSNNVVPESKLLVISVKPGPVSCLYSQPARGGHSSLSVYRANCSRSSRQSECRRHVTLGRTCCRDCRKLNQQSQQKCCPNISTGTALTNAVRKATPVVFTIRTPFWEFAHNCSGDRGRNLCKFEQGVHIWTNVRLLFSIPQADLARPLP